MSIKKNFLYNSALTVSQFIFPVITFPYAARVLGAEGIGITGFIESFSRYFLLFAVAGIPIHGLREIARNRSDPGIVERTFTEIYSIQFYLSVIATIVYFLSVIFIKDTERYELLYLMGGFLILSNIFSLEWVFQGFEDFKFITIRTVIIRALSIVLLFLLVKTPGDFARYFFLLVFSSVANGIVNMFYVRKYLKLKLTTSLRRLKIHLKPVALTGAYLLAISMYTLLTTILLGFISSETAVGYYTTAVKFSRIALGIFSALSVVLIPRLSGMAFDDNKEKYRQLIGKSISFVITFGLPVSVSMFLLAPELTNLFAGPGYEAAVICVRIMSPVVLISGMSQIFGSQILIPFSRDRQNIKAVITGAVLSVLANLLLIPLYGELGASVSTVAVELIVACITFYYAIHIISMEINIKELFLRVVLLFPFYLIAVICRYLSSGSFQIVASYTIAGSVYFLFVETILFKNYFWKDFGVLKPKPVADAII